MSRVFQSKQTGLIRKGVVSYSIGRGGATLIKELKIAWIHGHGLVVGRSNEVAGTDIVGPTGAAVGFTCKWVALRAMERSPRSTQTRRRERSEISSVRSLSLDNHEILIESAKSVNLNGFEEIGGGIREDGRVR